MFEAKFDENKNIVLCGRLDASQVENAKKILDQAVDTCKVNFEELEYISSAGLGILFEAQKRLTDNGKELILIKLNKHIRDIFVCAGFDLIFTIEDQLS